MKHLKKYSAYYPAAVALVVGFVGAFGVKVAVDHLGKDAEPATRVEQHNSNNITSVEPRVAREDISPLIAAHLRKDAAPSSDQLNRVYERFAHAPLWMDSSTGARRLKELAQVAANADAQAIDTSKLATLLATAGSRNVPADEAARIDVALTAETLRLAQAIRLGAVPTEKLGRSWVMPSDSFDAAAGVSEAIDKNNLKTFLNELAPKDPQYKHLINAYQTYREIVAQGGWPAIPGTDEIVFDKSDPRLTALQDRLTAEGYLPKGTTDTALTSEAVKRFQERNGLDADGRIGRGTLAALNVPAQERLAQIAANLERWRHTPHDRGEKFIAVNAASTTLDFIQSGESQLHLRVVTGTKRHATPILSAKITAVTLNPRWEIPPSIARNEILPHLKKNPNYLADNNMVVVDGDESDPHGQYVNWSNIEAEKLSFRFRQRAGDDNALGLIKFQMTNPQNIYLHDTPSRSYFARAERHLSHGCVRVDQPGTLAEHVLLQTPGWDLAKINEEIALGKTRSIILKEPLPVHISYWTVFSQYGAINFRNDIYERDAPLARALGLSPDAPPKTNTNVASN